MAIRVPLQCYAYAHPQPTAPLSDSVVGDGLACPARGNAAISAHLGVMGRISHLDTDCHTSDIGHWFAMTVLFGSLRGSVKCSDSGEF